MKRLFVLLFLLPWPAWAQPAPPATGTLASFGSPCVSAAEAAHPRGITILHFSGFEADGRLKDVVVQQSSGDAGLDQAAVRCVSRWRFDPGKDAFRHYLQARDLYIAWTSSDSSAAAPPAKKVLTGMLIGRPHVCLNDYPAAAWQAGIEGVTTVRFTITDKGRVEDVSVAESSGNADLDKAALTCVRYWRYKPAIRAGKPVAVPWQANIVWKIERPQVPPLEQGQADCVKARPVKAEDLADIGGVTVVHFTIASGEVRDVTVRQSSGNAALDKAAVACVAGRHYKRDMTAGLGGKPIWRSMGITERIDWHKALPAGK